MQAVLINPIDQSQIKFRLELCNVAAVRVQLWQISFSVPISILDARADFDAVMRNVLDMKPHRSCPVVEPCIGFRLGTDRLRNIPSLRAPVGPYFQMEQSRQRRWYFQTAFGPAPIGVISIIAVEIQSAVAGIPEVHIGGFVRAAFEQPKEK